ncbi:MAG: glycosyltransferase [Myxococcota bacterium]
MQAESTEGREHATPIYTRITERFGADLRGISIGVVALDGADTSLARALLERLELGGATVRVLGFHASEASIIGAQSLYDAVHRASGLVVIGRPGATDSFDLRRVARLMRRPIWFREPDDAWVEAEQIRSLGFEVGWTRGSGIRPAEPRGRSVGPSAWTAIRGVKIWGVPPGFSLPPVIGKGNDYRFIEARCTGVLAPAELPRVSLVVGLRRASGRDRIDDIEALVSTLIRRGHPPSRLQLILVHGENDPPERRPAVAAGVEVRVARGSTPAAAWNAGLEAVTAEITIMLDTDRLVPPSLVPSVTRWLLASDRAVVVSCAQPQALIERRLPFVDVDGRCIATSGAFLRAVGPFHDAAGDAAGDASGDASGDATGDRRSLVLEWAYRAYQAGAYFIPVEPDVMKPEPTPEPQDRAFVDDWCPLLRQGPPTRRYAVPKVSIYIPAFNAERTLREAVDSALAQDFGDLEVCVVDDGSTDRTRQVLERHYTDDPRVRWKSLAHAGISAASNAAIELGRGPYIGQLDADDVLRPHAVRTLVEILDAHDLGLVYASNDMIDADGGDLGPGWEWPIFCRTKLMVSNIVHHFRMYRRRDWMRVGGFDRSFSNAEDYDLALRMSERCEIRHVVAPLYLYRRHQRSDTAVNSERMHRNHHRAMRRALCRMGLDNTWEILPSPRWPRREGIIHRKHDRMTPCTTDTALDRVVQEAQALLETPPGPDEPSLREIALELAADRYMRFGWWQHPDSSSHLQATEPALLGRLVAARVEADRACCDAALRHVTWVLSRLPMDLCAQRLAEQLKCALGQPGWSEEDEADLQQRFCIAPFERMETRPDGQVKFCCNSWLDVSIGNIHEDPPEAIWNSTAAQKVRASILDGRYTYCSRTRCPRILNKTLPRRDEITSGFSAEVLAERPTVLSSKPRDLKLNHDRSCNLSCPSCRRSVYTADRAEYERLNAVADTVLFPLLEEARIVEITGSGDAFASRHFRYILETINAQDFPHLRIDLFTNGLMFNEASWTELGLEGLCRRAVISVDSTREHSYSLLRRGGQLSRLLANLPFISSLRRRGQLERVVLVFVIQRDNFEQIPEMIELTKRFDFDETFLKVLDRWGQPISEYADKNVASPDHPLHPELLRILRDPQLDDPVVNLGTLRPAYDRARA